MNVLLEKNIQEILQLDIQIPFIGKSILKETLTPRTQRLVSAKAKNYYWLQSTIYEIALPSPVTHQKGENCIVGIYWEGTILSSK